MLLFFILVKCIRDSHWSNQGPEYKGHVSCNCVILDALSAPTALQKSTELQLRSGKNTSCCRLRQRITMEAGACLGTAS
ncbi:hypothetical protein DY000_02039065 [Brassica cretica]|uniref:Uncharacterized protein n=1 Tax=Brassica cretica TaxID=69181 RepID=A0ABQ7BPQ2_BRACR|nr:hypothetical protein DY000_02039065 [Brassica cretica]